MVIQSFQSQVQNLNAILSADLKQSFFDTKSRRQFFRLFGESGESSGSILENLPFVDLGYGHDFPRDS